MFIDFLSLLFSKIFFFTGMVQSKGTFPKPLSAEEEKKYLALARNGDKKAKEIILEHEQVLHSCANLLLEKEKISREEFEGLFVQY